MGESTAPAILVIDDDEHLRNMLAFALRDRGYQVVAVKNGALALVEAQGQRFDAAICDIVMPGLGGVATLKQLKQAQPDLEVIMATGHATPGTALASIKNGAYSYITKPYELKDLCMLLEKALSARPRKPRSS